MPAKNEKRGSAGEMHQLDHGERQTLPTNQGTAISDDQNSLRENQEPRCGEVVAAMRLGFVNGKSLHCTHTHKFCFHIV